MSKFDNKLTPDWCKIKMLVLLLKANLPLFHKRDCFTAIRNSFLGRKSKCFSLNISILTLNHSKSFCFFQNLFLLEILVKKNERIFCLDINDIFWVFLKTKFSLNHLISIHILFCLDEITYFKGTWVYSMSSDFHCANCDDVYASLRWTLWGFAVMFHGPQCHKQVSMMRKVLLTTFVTLVSLLYFCIRKGIGAVLIFQQAPKPCLKVKVLICVKF